MAFRGCVRAIISGKGAYGGKFMRRRRAWKRGSERKSSHITPTFKGVTG